MGLRALFVLEAWGSWSTGDMVCLGRLVHLCGGGMGHPWWARKPLRQRKGVRRNMRGTRVMWIHLGSMCWIGSMERQGMRASCSGMGVLFLFFGWGGGHRLFLHLDWLHLYLKYVTWSSFLNPRPKYSLHLNLLYLLFWSWVDCKLKNHGKGREKNDKRKS